MSARRGVVRAGVGVAVLVGLLVVLGFFVTRPANDPAILAAAVPTVSAFEDRAARRFDGERALAYAAQQVGFGPRPSGSAALRQAGDAILAELERCGWQTETQEFEYMGTPIRNLTGKAAIGAGPVVIIGAHYDTRRVADEDPVDPTAPMVGANDGASGVGVLLELACTLDSAAVGNEIWLVFFDAEDNGRLDGWDWIVGSTYYAEHLTITPAGMVLVDLVGDANQELYYERNSTPEWRERIWQVAGELGYGSWFVPTPRYSIIDDHTPFLRAGIPAVDIIDFDYPYWHTTEDTLDKLSADSLERVGRTVETLLEQNLLPP